MRCSSGREPRDDLFASSRENERGPPRFALGASRARARLPDRRRAAMTTRVARREALVYIGSRGAYAMPLTSTGCPSARSGVPVLVLPREECFAAARSSPRRAARDRCSRGRARALVGRLAVRSALSSAPLPARQHERRDDRPCRSMSTRSHDLASSRSTRVRRRSSPSRRASSTCIGRSFLAPL